MSEGWHRPYKFTVPPELFCLLLNSATRLWHGPATGPTSHVAVELSFLWAYTKFFVPNNFKYFTSFLPLCFKSSYIQTSQSILFYFFNTNNLQPAKVNTSFWFNSSHIVSVNVSFSLSWGTGTFEGTFSLFHFDLSINANLLYSVRVLLSTHLAQTTW